MMASLRYTQVRTHTDRVMSYIADEDKMISSKVHDVHNVLSYMGTPESIERVYSFSKHCSANPALAAVQMELYRARYYESKTGGIQGLREGKNELLGLHFFLSYSEEDSPSEDTMNAITTALAEHSLCRDFAVFGANHFDKLHRHSHFYVCQYSAQGKPRKLCMKKKAYNDLRKYANRLCVEHGLSIIDLQSLRHNDPEYSAWVDGVIAEGKITVHPEAEAHKGARRQKASTQDIYYKWLRDTEEFNVAEEQRLTEAQRNSKNAAQTYFWNFENNSKKRPYYISNDPQRRYYAVKRYDDNGRQRSLVELIIMLLVVICSNETAIQDAQQGETDYVIHAKVDRNAQAMMDSIRLARELNTDTPAEVAAKIKDTGTQMNGLKKEMSRLEASVASQAHSITAWEQYELLHGFVEDTAEPDAQILQQYNSARAVLEQNQILTDDDFEQLRIRNQFQTKKLADYQKRMSALKQHYRGLKRLEALVTTPGSIADKFYINKQEMSLDGKIQSAKKSKKTCTQQPTGPLREEYT